MDAIFILDRGQRSEGAATLVCTGRDIETRKLDLRFSKSDCTWELVQDSLENRAKEMPEELTALIEFMRSALTFSGSNMQLACAVSKLVGNGIAPKSLKQMMNRWRYILEEKGVFFRSHRSNGQRLVTISFSSAHPIVTEVPQVTQHQAVPDLPSLATLTVPKPRYSLGKTPAQRNPPSAPLAPL